MVTVGPNGPSSAISSGGLGTSWSNLDGALDVLGQAAHSDNFDDTDGTEMLHFTGFGFSVPTGSSIDGIFVEFIGNSDFNGDSVTWNRVSIRYSGSLLSSVFNPSEDVPPGSYTYFGFGGNNDTWGIGALSPTHINDSSFGVGFGFIASGGGTPVSTVYVDYARVTVYYTPPNTAPTISTAPSVDYAGSNTRLGPNATPAVVTFTATDAEQTAADELTWSLYTGANQTGTQVATGTCTSGTQESVNIAYNASGISEGSNTLYLSVNDGTVDSSDSSFTVLMDSSAPTVGTITHSPDPVVGS